MCASKPTHSETSSVMKSVRLQSRTICAPATSKTNVSLPSGGWGHHKLNRRADGGGGDQKGQGEWTIHPQYTYTSKAVVLGWASTGSELSPVSSIMT
jgi:hypothetical protein